jgi:hypothetical protein
MSAQADMFPVTTPSTSLIGITIVLPRPCRACGEVMATIGSSRGPHHAALFCVSCGRHTGWMSQESFNFVCALIDNFGRPESAIVVRESVNHPSSWSL